MLKMLFLNMRTQTALKKNKTVRTSIPYKQASNVGIIFTVEDKEKHEAIKDLIQQLERDGKKVQVLEFLPEKKLNHEFKFDFFSVKDISFLGELTSALALKFAEAPFDYLFCIDKQSNPLVLHLVARSKAHCRVGKFNEADSPYFEMMIEQNGTTEGLIESMYNYTSQLR
jgi:hypothetical protein